MRPRTLTLIVVGIVGALVLGSVAFLVLQQLLSRTLLPGEQALELLRGSPYPNLVVEVDYTPGDRPTSTALNLMEARIATHTDKDTIRFVFEVIAVNETQFTTLDLLELERTHRDEITAGDTFTVYVLSVAGELTDGEGTALGVSYTASSLAIFKDVIRLATAGPGPSLAEVESSVLVHEVGHLMGLVNLVYTSDMDYEDATHPFHSVNTTDVMFWAIDSAPFMQPPNDFGFETRFDLEKLRNGEYEIIPSRLRELASASDAADRTGERVAVFEVQTKRFQGGAEDLPLRGPGSSL
ncbi:MAG: hypothetical protein R3291_01935 [Thermoplasmata archaeon]|nr:hypothetical protein [Thermoplasmata archaeon]